MQDGYLLDTAIASALWDEKHKKHGVFRERLRALGDAPVFVSVVSLAEVEYGLRIAPRIDRGRQAKVRSRMAQYTALPLDQHVIEGYAELRSRLFKKHSPRDRRGRLTAKRVPDLWERTPDKLLGIQENDLWLASVAMERNLVLVTTDRMRHIALAAGTDLHVDSWR